MASGYGAPMSSLLLPLGLGSVALAGDPSVAHEHQGHLAPYVRPAALSLSAAEQASLKAGDPVVRSTRSDAGGAGQAVQYVHAPAETVWDVILDYDRYPERVKNVVKAEVYRGAGTDVFFVDMISRNWGVSTTIYSRNELHRAEGWMAWTLDYSRSSDIGDLAGYWRVEELQSSPPLTRLDHGTALELSGVPSFVVSYLTKQGLVDGTSWVKETAEALSR